MTAGFAGNSSDLVASLDGKCPSELKSLLAVLQRCWSQSLASEGHGSEEDRFSLNAEFPSSASNGDSGRSFPSQMSTQQTGIATALSVLKRVKLPRETGPPVFKRDSFASRFEIKPQMIGLSDVLNPQPKVRAAVPA